MTRIATLALVLVLAGLGVVVARELAYRPARTVAVAPATAPLDVPGAPAAGPDPRAEAAAILARPLFEPSRRPPAGAAATAATTPNALPRLTAVLVSSRGRAVIFAGADGGRPVSVIEGGRIGNYVVLSIGAGQATLAGPDGQHVLRPTFLAQASAGPAPSAVPAAPIPSILDLLRNQPPSVGIPGLPSPPPPPPRQ